MGITLNDNDIGLVPDYEEREACVYTSVPWHIYQKYTWYEKAAMVAHYRMHLLIDMHVNKAAEKAATAASASRK